MLRHGSGAGPGGPQESRTVGLGGCACVPGLGLRRNRTHMGFLGLGGQLITPNRRGWLGAGCQPWPGRRTACGRWARPVPCGLSVSLRPAPRLDMVALLLRSLPGRNRFVLVPEAGDVYAETSE